MNKNIGDMSKEELYELCNELLDKDTDYMLLQRKIDKAIEEIDNIIKLQEITNGILTPTRYSKIKNILKGEDK